MGAGRLCCSDAVHHAIVPALFVGAGRGASQCFGQPPTRFVSWRSCSAGLVASRAASRNPHGAPSPLRYSRLFVLTKSQLLNVDPDNFQVTNTWKLAEEVVDFEPSVSSDTEFTVTVRSGRSNEVRAALVQAALRRRHSASLRDLPQVFKYGSDFRSDLLCDLAEAVTGSQPVRTFSALKLTRDARRVDCGLAARGWGLVMYAPDGKLVQTYSFKEITRIQAVLEDPSQLAVWVAGRARLFACPDRSDLIKGIAAAATRVGKPGIIADSAISSSELRKARAEYGADSSPQLLQLDVLKRTPKYHTPRSRKLVVTEKHILERDVATYQVISARPLASLHAIVRHDDEPQTLTFEFKDSSSRTFITSKRDQLLAAVLDGAHLGGNVNVDVKPTVSLPGSRALPRAAAGGEAQGVVDTMYLAALGRACKGAAGVTPYSSELLAAAQEFNDNVPPTGVPYTTRKSSVNTQIATLLQVLSSTIIVPGVPGRVLVTLLGTLKRLITSKEGYKLAMTLPEAGPVLLKSLHHHDDGVLHAACELQRRLLHNPRRPPGTDSDSEAQVKGLVLTEAVRVALIGLVDSHSSAAGGSLAAGSEGTLVVSSVVAALDSILISNVDTTSPEAADHLMQLVASRYASLLAMFRSDVPSIVECAAMLMRAIVTKADQGTVRAMQAAALSTGVLLRHFYNALCAASFDQRYVSRYLVELWSTGNPTAHDFFRHSLPAGLLVYLDMPPLSDAERLNLEMMERATVDDAAAAAAAAGVSNPLEGASSTGAAASTDGAAGSVAGASGLASRLRRRLAAADAAEKGRAIRRMKALTPEVAGSARRTRFGKDNAAEAALKAAHAAAAEAAVAAQAIMTKAKLEAGGRRENYVIFFHMIMQDHNLPDLIWNQQTRGELRAALDNELREVEMEIVLGGPATRKGSVLGADTSAKAASAVAAAKAAAEAGKAPVATAAGDGPLHRPRAGSTRASMDAKELEAATGVAEADAGGQAMDVAVQLRYAWNHAEFQVQYPSLAQELKVGDQYLRLFLEGGTAGVRSLREPSVFWDALYRRALRETAPNLKSMCLKGMARVYEVHWKVLGPFEDTDYIVWMLAQTWNNNVRDHLLLLLHALALHPINCEKMINDDAMRLFVDLLATAHTVDSDRRAMPVAKVGGGLLLTDGSAGGRSSGAAPGAPPVPSDEGAASEVEGHSMKVWHYQASARDLREGEEADKGPFSLQDMHQLGHSGAITNITMVWAHGMRNWVRLDSLRPVAWYVLSEGEAKMTPLQRGELAAKLLLRLAKLRPPVDAEGNPVRPVPKVKRVLTSAACLPHIAQAMLAGSTELVDLVAELVMVLLEHNPKANVKLYLTGIFFFIMVYPRSNWDKMAQLLAATHLEQSFHHEASSIARENTLSKQSILGDMLPESLLHVLVNEGGVKFVHTFLSNVDNPEVIWKYGMRNHLVEMVTQHLGDLPGRLAANPCTLYDYCPIPRVVYEELDNELWCANFYLANLTDESRFPDWEIKDPVNLLRAVLDAWRLEMDKEDSEEMVSADDAAQLLGVDKDADDKTIRKAYRKAAMKFHPDKNPAGREMFEKIQVAYEMLTSARPEAISGPDPVAITLMIKTQCILFKRYAAPLKPYKYAGYPLLLGQNSLTHPPEVSVTGPEAALIEAAANCVYLTCLASPRNAEELVREQGVDILLDILARAVRDVDPLTEPKDSQAGIGSSAAGAAVPSDTPPAHGDATARGAGAAGREARTAPGQLHGIGTLEHVLHTLSGLATLPDARGRMQATAGFSENMVKTIRYQLAPRVMQYSLDCICRLAVETSLQDSLVDAGVLWRLIPLLFRYDLTLEAAQSAGDGSVANTQKAANLQAKLSARAFSRLGGYLDGALTTPKNDRVQRMLRAILTPILARRLVRTKPDALLDTLVNTTERADVVWTAAMRTELLELATSHIEAMDRGEPPAADDALGFSFKALADLLQLSGIYVKFYLADPGLTLDDPYAFLRDVFRHIVYSKAGAGPRLASGQALPAASSPGELSLLDPEDAEVAEECAKCTLEAARRHLRTALRALHLVIVHNPGLEDEVSGDSSKYLPSLFALLSVSEEGMPVIDDLAELSDKKGGVGGGVALQSAAGSGMSAGAGGARSTAASSTAPLRELVLTAIAAFISEESCTSAVTSLHLIPGLIRLLPHDAAGVGGVLRSMFTHASAVEEVGATGCIIDLCTIFAGGVASGPAPGTPGGPPLSQRPSLSMPLAARQQAGALLSLMCSDSTYGPPNLLSLSQLLPEAMAMNVKQSLSAATGTGGGAAGVGTTGTGTGAAGAGNDTGDLGDAVKILDADHETPELVWDITSRHELRVALGELGRGLTGFRKRLGAKEGAAGPDSVRWSMPATFRVQYSVTEGELRVGGVYVRLFLKEPTFPLRDPKGFLEACLRRLMQEGNHLIGMTSEDASEVSRATAAAKAEAAEEEKAGGVKASHIGAKGEAGKAGESLVLRGEDVATQVTHAIVCLLRTRVTLREHVSALGYVDQLVPMLGRCAGKPARFDLGIQCVRILQVLAADKVCVVAMAKCNAVREILRSLSPLHRDAAFTLEMLKDILTTDQTVGHGMVAQMLQCKAVETLMAWLRKDDVSDLKDPSAFKVHLVAILKLLEGDQLHGARASAELAGHAALWDRYKHQRHDLFISKNDTRDYFLTDVEKAPSLLLKNAAEHQGSAGAAGGSPKRGASGAPLMIADDTKPPPPPSFGGSSQATTGGFGGFQAPAPAPSAGFGGFQAPAPAPRSYAAPPASASLYSAPAPAPARSAAADPFAGLGSAAPAPAPAQAADPFAGLGSSAPAPAPAAAASGDPFADLGLAPSPAPAPAASGEDDLFAGMSTSSAPAPASATARKGYVDPFAGLD